MRKLNTRDCFKMFRIIKQTGLKNEVQSLLAEAKGQVNAQKFGIRVMFTLFDSMADPKVEEALYDLLNDVTGEDVSSKGIDELTGILKRIAEENNLTSFFKQAANIASS